VPRGKATGERSTGSPTVTPLALVPLIVMVKVPGEGAVDVETLSVAETDQSTVQSGWWRV
jgi:hypothetical protein